MSAAARSADRSAARPRGSVSAVAAAAASWSSRSSAAAAASVGPWASAARSCAARRCHETAASRASCSARAAACSSERRSRQPRRAPMVGAVQRRSRRRGRRPAAGSQVADSGLGPGPLHQRRVNRLARRRPPPGAPRTNQRIPGRAQLGGGGGHLRAHRGARPGRRGPLPPRRGVPGSRPSSPPSISSTATARPARASSSVRAASGRAAANRSTAAASPADPPAGVVAIPATTCPPAPSAAEAERVVQFGHHRAAAPTWPRPRPPGPAPPRRPARPRPPRSAASRSAAGSGGGSAGTGCAHTGQSVPATRVGHSAAAAGASLRAACGSGPAASGAGPPRRRPQPRPAPGPRRPAGGRRAPARPDLRQRPTVATSLFQRRPGGSSSRSARARVIRGQCGVGPGQCGVGDLRRPHPQLVQPEGRPHPLEAGPLGQQPADLLLCGGQRPDRGLPPRPGSIQGELGVRSVLRGQLVAGVGFSARSVSPGSSASPAASSA